jgi:hypothetical protein
VGGDNFLTNFVDRYIIRASAESQKVAHNATMMEQAIEDRALFKRGGVNTLGPDDRYPEYDWRCLAMMDGADMLQKIQPRVAHERSTGYDGRSERSREVLREEMARAGSGADRENGKEAGKGEGPSNGGRLIWMERGERRRELRQQTDRIFY